MFTSKEQDAMDEASTSSKKLIYNVHKGPKVTKLVRGPKEVTKYTPSTYLAEMRLTTEEKLEKTYEMHIPKIVELLDISESLQKDSVIEVDSPLFQPFPSEVFFQQYKPHLTYEFPISFRNNDNVARHIKVSLEESPYFKVTCQKSVGAKVAPGMEITYIIAFTPDEDKDYAVELTCITEREKFVVPVVATGSRALLDFPDEMNFSLAPVKYPSSKTVLVRNVGRREAKFTLETVSPFSVKPTTASLAPNTCMQVDIEFLPQTVGEHSGTLEVHHDTGEVLYTQLQGSANDVNVRLDRSSIMHENTYIGLSSKRSVTIQNRSDVTAHFVWKAFGSESDEEMQKELHIQELSEEESFSKESFLQRCVHNPTMRDRYPILVRHLERSKKHYLETEHFHFCSDVFTIDPMEGDIWPNAQAEVSITFSPYKAISYSQVAYCDVTGRESRLPLKLKGEGMGPNMRFSFDTLDIQNIFVNSSHVYEVILENKGDIAGAYSMLSSQTLFGPKFAFVPQSGTLQPGGFQAIQISFSSSVLGEFSELFLCKVEGSPQDLQLQIKGAVIGPTFLFNVAELRFGDVAYGFQTLQEVELTNTSEVPMTFNLSVPSNGATTENKPKEFVVKPRTGVLPPNCRETITVRLTPSFVKFYSAALVVDISEAGKEVFSLPITAQSVVPTITLTPSLLDYGRCFVNYPYTKNLVLKNESNLPAIYESLPPLDLQSLVFSTTAPKGIVEPHSTLWIPLQIKAQVQGEITSSYTISILGSTDPPLKAEVYCIGEGPVISVAPSDLDWGVCPVLTPIAKKVTLVNESLISAEIECVLAQEKTVFTVDPFSAMIQPEQRVELTITAFMDDALKFNDKLTIVVTQGVSATINLSAEAKGTTIVSYPPLMECINLGPHFSKGLCQKQFTLINKGRRVQALSWSTDGFSLSKLKRLELEKASRDTLDPTTKQQPHSQTESMKKPLFEIIPDKLVLEPYQSQAITLKGFSPIPQVVSERLLCHALIGKNPHKERIMTVDVHAQFISPLLEFSSLNLTFLVHQPIGSKLIQHKEVVHVKNVSPLPVTAVLSCAHPFSLATDKSSVPQMELKLSEGEEIDITVCYDATYCIDKYSRVEESQLTVSYKEHPHKDKIVLRSEVHFPNLSFEAVEIDFGCILNDTETTKQITVTNCSPLEVHYMWSFLKRPPARRVDPEQLDEGVDMQSEIETDSFEEQEDEEEHVKDEEEHVEDEEEHVKDEEATGEFEATNVEEGSKVDEEDKKEIAGDSTQSGDEDKERNMEEGKENTGELQQSSSQCSKDVTEKTKSGPLPAKHIRGKHPLVQKDSFTPISIEQVFDILPLHGVLQPGQSEEVQFTFHGHTGIATEVMAVCRVEGGPAYQLRLMGESSIVEYRISRTHIEVGKQLYDQVLTADIVIQNRGKVAMGFTVFGASHGSDCTPGQIVVSPVTGHIPALEQQMLTIQYLPGVPEMFNKSFQVQVAHFEPETIMLTGEGVFPCITFSLPRVEASQSTQAHIPAEGDATDMAANDRMLQLEREMQRLFVKEFAVQHPENLNSKAKKIRPILPEFLLDFGHTVYGLVTSNVVTLRNIGHCPVSFSTQRSALQDTGFSVDLGDKVKSLPGAPEFESLQFNVRFDSASAKCAEGHIEARLPVNLVNGPGYIIKLTADVARPKIELSSSMIDFGTVLCGQCKVVTVRLHNPYFVKCEWSAITDKPPKKIPKHVPLHLRKKMKEKPPPKYFEVEPSSGILLPDQKKDIQVWFMPSETHHYVETIPFAIKHNTESQLFLHVEGLGNEPKISFNHTLVEFPPVLPFSPGSEVQVEIANPTAYPVEVYSLEFDKQHIEEETILKWLKERYKLKKLFLPPITPGGKLPREILEAYSKERGVAKAAATAGAADDPSGDTGPAKESTISVEQSESQLRLPSALMPSSTNVEQKVGTYETKTGLPSSSALAPSAVELSVINSLTVLSQATLGTQHSETEVDSNPVTAAVARYLGLDLSPEAVLAGNRRGIALIVSGPPQSGKTTQAKALAELYGAAVLAVDDVLIDAISSASTPAGCKAREYCMQTVEITVEEEASPQVSQKKPQKDVAKDEPPSQPVEAPQFFPVLSLEGSQFSVPAGTLPYKALPEELVVDILADRMQHKDCSQGVVVDGIDSRFTAGTLMTAALILRAFNNRKHIYFVELSMELPALEARMVELELERERKARAEADARREAEEQEEKRIAALLDLPEDEYENLDEEQKKAIDARRLALYKDKRRKRQAEEEERQRLKREKEEEERRLEDEKQKRRGRGAKETAKRHSVVAKVAGTLQKGSPTGNKEAATPNASDQLLGGNIPTASGSSLILGTETPTQSSKRRSKKDPPAVALEQIAAKPGSSLGKRYTLFESGVGAIHQLLEDWDRNTGEVRTKPQPDPEEAKTTPSKKSKGKQKPASRSDSLERVNNVSTQPTEPPIQEVDESRAGVGVPMIVMDGNQGVKSITDRILSSNLPSPVEILNGMGLGPSGSPMPAPAVFQVYPYSLKRETIDSANFERFVFIAASPDDPNCRLEEPAKPSTEIPEESMPEVPPPHSRMSKRGASSTKSVEPSDRRSPQKLTAKRKTSLKSNSPVAQTVPHDEQQPSISEEPVKPLGPAKLVRFRWIIPPQGQTVLRLQFSSLEEGQFDKTLNFEVVGTRQRYQLFCRGVCVVPSICREPRIIFSNRKKTIESNEIVHKKYVISEETYFFGPLHCGKTRERYREGRYPENMETLTISNTSVMEADVLFCFKSDFSAATFLVEPAQMILKPGESKTLTIWAYPKTLGTINDALVCCIKNNPDPVVLNISCDGVEPELKIDKKILEFKKVLLHRKQTNVLHLHNNTLLPVAWKLSGTEMLGEEFSFSQERGVVQPRSAFPLNVHFRAAKPVSYTKRTFKIEVSDVEQIMGLMHVEAVQIQAEAYDVALDVSFPRGTDGGLDFQCVKVFDESKLILHLKNKGKYDIAYNFLSQPLPNVPDCFKMFSIVPNHSTLYPGEKAQAVTIAFRPQGEVVLVDQAILKCQVIDVHVGEQGEVIANIPIKVTARAVFSKFSICPINDLNFGYMMFGTRKTCTFTLENKGEFEFKYAFIKLLSEQQKQRVATIAAAAAAKRAKSREGVASAQSSQVFKAKGKGAGGPGGVSGAAMRTEVIGGSQRLVLSLFTVNSAMGVILPGQSVVISVECVADKPGKHEEDLCVEISDRHKNDPQITYKIRGEVLVPAISTSDIASVFEEHRICRQLGVLGQHKFHEDGCIGVYGEEDETFLFKSVIVGQTAKARFKICNPNKILCDVNISVKSSTVQKVKGTADIFEVEPSKVTIPSHSHVYAVVTFKPTSMQSYSATFEAVAEGSQSMKAKGLTFELQGEGNLPQVSIEKPVLRNAQGQPLLLFKRLMVGHTQSLPVLVRNVGTIPATLVVAVISGHQSFSVVQPNIEEEEEEVEEVKERMEEEEVMGRIQDRPAARQASTVVKLGLDEVKELNVLFQPAQPEKCNGELQLKIEDNQFENLRMVLVGEGYKEDVGIDNIQSAVDEGVDGVSEEVESANTLQAHVNHMQFGGCPVGESKQLSFVLSNHSASQAIRFQWPTAPGLTFSPALGHLHPSSSKDILVSFRPLKPQTMAAQRMCGKICKINFSQELSQVPDWDDRMKSVRWVTVPHQSHQGVQEASPTSPGKPPPTPAKQKVIETEPEPPHSVVEGSSRDLEMTVSGVAGFTKYECSTTEVKFRDTLMFQTRVFSFPVKNTGLIPLSYKWTALNQNGDMIRDGTEPKSSVIDAGTTSVSVCKEVLPFSVSPSSGLIPVGQETSFTVRFSPLDLVNMECIFRCNIPHMDQSCRPLNLLVQGQSLMPYCHFELEENNYLAQRQAETRGGLGTRAGPAVDSATRVIEFHSRGIGVKNHKEFSIINPTASGYEFNWTQENPSASPFKCLTPRGYIAGGKKHEIAFDFTPSNLELVETFWTFSIPSLSISLPFLLVGQSVEPAVNMDRAYVNFRSMFVGTQSQETVYLLNDESIPYHFAFSEQSCQFDGHSAQVLVEPMSGTIQPKTKLPIQIQFAATQEREYSFNLLCHVKRKLKPLVLNVKAQGYAINTAITCKGPDGKEFELQLDKAVKRAIDFKQVHVNEKSLWELCVYNHGLYSFEYKWRLSEKCLQLGSDGGKVIMVQPEEGVVPAHDKVKCSLVFSPAGKMSLKGSNLTLSITNGPSISRPDIVIALKGQSVEPLVEFSFMEYNFGYSFLYRPDMPLNKAILSITNKDSKDISINCLFTSKQGVEVDFEPKLLPPGGSCEAIVVFKPRDAIKYYEEVPFEINGLLRKTIAVRGEGTQTKIELVNPVQRTVNFGALRVNQTASKKVKLINRSPISVVCSVSIMPSSSVPALQAESVLFVSPSGDFSLLPNAIKEIEITFSPKSRVTQFSEEVTLECLGYPLPLLIVTGSCQGLEITLDSDHVPFGAVVLKSQSERRVLMHNSGDIGARFHWEAERFAPDFSITPVEGYISPGMEVTFDITFHPVAINPDIRYERLSCHIEDANPLLLTLTGMCIEQVPLKDVIHFFTSVRGKEMRQLTISNKTNSTWLLKPIIDGEYWSGPESISIPPNQNHHYELTYQPLVMTPEPVKHQGSIFFPLPDGNGLLYNLLGTAEPPKQAGCIQQEIPCKTHHTELMTVKNWLKRPQRFKVIREITRPEKLDRSVLLDGMDYIDVPALSKRDYKLKFYSFKECSIAAKITFCNEQTGEYLFYIVQIKFVPSGVIGTIELKTQVRKSVSYMLTIDNPLPSPVTVTTATNVSDISLPSTFILGAQSMGNCMFEFLPLRVGDATGKLTLTSSELGVYQYELHLVATPPAPERAVHFTTNLGGSHQQQCRFVSYAKGRTEYSCKIDNNDFHVEKSINVASAGSSGTEVTIEVTFEPSHLGDTQAILTISSPTGGDYTIPLHGHCLVPKPQGPFVIKAGATTNISFKNVFGQITQFNFSLDNPAFTLKASSESIKPRKTYNIAVTYDTKQADSNTAKVGKLVVSSQGSARSSGGISWTYYLKGVPHS